MAAFPIAQQNGCCEVVKKRLDRISTTQGDRQVAANRGRSAVLLDYFVYQIEVLWRLPGRLGHYEL